MNTALLDDTEKISAIDKSGMLDFCINAPKHYREAAKIAEKIKVDYPNQTTLSWRDWVVQPSAVTYSKTGQKTN